MACLVVVAAAAVVEGAQCERREQKGGLAEEVVAADRERLMAKEKARSSRLSAGVVVVDWHDERAALPMRHFGLGEEGDQR